MQISCGECGRPLAEIEPLAIGKDDAMLRSSVRAFTGITGIDLGPAMAVLANPTPDAITSVFKVRCPNGQHLAR